MNISLVAGTRPNFIKIAPIIHSIERHMASGSSDLAPDKNIINYRLVHTGQHYDQLMSDTFFKELNIPQPDTNLGCGGGTQAEQQQPSWWHLKTN